MQNLTTIFNKSKNILKSNLEDEQDIYKNSNIPDDTYPFEYFMQIPNRLKAHKFFQDIKIGDIVIGTITRIFTTKLEISLICTMGTIVRDIYDLNIPAICSSRELPILSNFASVQSFRRGDLIKSIVIDIAKNEGVELSMNHNNPANRLRHTDLGLYPNDKLPEYYKKLTTSSNPPVLFYDLFEKQPLLNVIEIKDKLQFFNWKTTNFSLFDEVNRIEIRSNETAKSLRNSLLMKESKKFVVKGVEYYKDHKYTEALQCYNHALSINESNVDALVARGALRATLNSFELSIADLEKAVQIEPTHKNAALYLSKTIIAYGKSLPKSEIQKAETLIQKQLILENEIKEHSKSDFSNPNNFIVVSDDELSSSNRSKHAPHKPKRKKNKKKHRKSHKSSRKRARISSDSRSSDDSSASSQSSTDSSSSDGASPRRSYKQKRPRLSAVSDRHSKRSLTSSDSESKSQQQIDYHQSRVAGIDPNQYSDTGYRSKQPPTHSNSFDQSYRPQKFPDRPQWTSDYRSNYRYQRPYKAARNPYFQRPDYGMPTYYRYDDKADCGGDETGGIDGDWRVPPAAVQQNSFEPSDYRPVKSTWSYYNDSKSARSPPRQPYTGRWCSMSGQEDDENDHTSPSAPHYRNYNNYGSHSTGVSNRYQIPSAGRPAPIDSVTEAPVALQNGTNSLSVEENPKLKAADEEIKKIEEFISQLKNNIKP